MRSAIKLSREQFEDFIAEKVFSRLKIIVWGENCDSLKEALTFREEWLFGDTLEPTLQAEMAEYLFKEGFCPKKTILNGKKYSTWCFPFNARNTTFARIKAEYASGLNGFLKFCEAKATEVITNFSYSNSEIIYIDVRNRIYRKIIQDKLVEYNRALMVEKNSRYNNDTREYIYYQLTRNEDIIFLSKSGYFYDYIIQAEAKHNAEVISAVHKFLLETNKAIYWCKYGEAPRWLVTFIPSQYIKDFRNIFESVGFEITTLPKHSERYYAPIGVQGDDFVPIFIEISKIDYKPLIQDDFGINKLYYELYRDYR